MKRMAGLIAVIVATSAVMLITGAGSVGSQPPAERRTISLFDPDGTDFERLIERRPRGVSSGDLILFVDKQLDPETCERVGRNVGRLHVIRRTGPNDALQLTDVTVMLADGKIVASGGALFSEFGGTEPVFAVTGGTEAYRDASGEVSFQEGVTMCGTQGALATIDLGPPTP
jgi:hypothetical protein